MARRGRFGRATSGSANLSSFISNLIQNSIQRNESALLNAFNDQTMFGGAVPNAGDIEAYVNSRTAGLDPNSSEFAYYQNMLENAKRADRSRTANSAAASFDATSGDSYEDFYSQVSGLLGEDLSPEERQEFEALLSEKSADFVDVVGDMYSAGSVSFDELLSKTDIALGRLSGSNLENAIVSRADKIITREGTSFSNGQVTKEGYRTAVDTALRGLDEGSPTTSDLKVKYHTLVWNAEESNKYRKVLNAGRKGTGAEIKATKAYIDWAQEQLAALEADGLGQSELANKTIRNTIASYRDNLSELQVRAGNEAYTARKSDAQNAEAALNEFASLAATYVTGANMADLQDQVGGVTIDAVLKKDPFALVRYFDLFPEEQARFDAAYADYKDAANAFRETAKATGAGTKGDVATIRSNMKRIGEFAGQDTAIEDYEDAYDIRVQKVAEANGDDSVLQRINREWLSFLSGQNTTTFGKGIATTPNAQIGGLIQNERDIYRAGVEGVAVQGFGNTLRDFTMPRAETGRTNTEVEADNAAKTRANAEAIETGRSVRFIDANGIGSTIPSREVNRLNGEFMFLEKNASGINVPTIRQGVPVVATALGQEAGTWGYHFPDKGLWVDGDGKTYTKPPFKVSNGGFPETDADGNPTRVTFQIDPEVREIPTGRNPAEFALYSDDAVDVSIVKASLPPVSAGFSGAGFNLKGVDAIRNSLTPDEQKEFDQQVQEIRTQSAEFNAFRAGERNLGYDRKANVDAAAAVDVFDRFIGNSSKIDGVARRAEILSLAPNKQAKWRYMNYADAYVEKSPGVFVRKPEATEVSTFGKPLDEKSQYFPAVIDVSKSISDPKVAPFVKTPKGTTSGPSVSQDFFFRNVSRGRDGGMTTGVKPPTPVSSVAAMTSSMRPGDTYSETFASVRPRASVAPVKALASLFPTAPVQAMGAQFGLKFSEGDTQSEAIGMLRALEPKVSKVTPVTTRVAGRIGGV